MLLVLVSLHFIASSAQLTGLGILYNSRRMYEYRCASRYEPDGTE